MHGLKIIDPFWVYIKPYIDIEKYIEKQHTADCKCLECIKLDRFLDKTIFKVVQ